MFENVFEIKLANHLLVSSITVFVKVCIYGFWNGVLVCVTA